MCVVKAVVKREPKTKQEIFWTDFVRYHVVPEAYLVSATTGPWQVTLRLKGSLMNRPISELNGKLEDYLEAAYFLGEAAGFSEALELLHNSGLVNGLIEQPKVLARLQKLAFEAYWLTLRLDRSKLRRNERLAQKAAKLSYIAYRLFEKALKAAKAER
jgi:hypothetical protein